MTQGENAVAVITGAGSGIGRGLTLLLAKRGMTVIASDLNETRADETRDARHQDAAAAGHGVP